MENMPKVLIKGRSVTPLLLLDLSANTIGFDVCFALSTHLKSKDSSLKVLILDGVRIQN